MKKIVKIAVVALVLLVVLGVVAIIVKKYMDEKSQSGVLLAFDDYAIEDWEEHFDLFDEYDAKVTFFITASEPSEFCAKAVERGHQIGFHTVGHIDLKEVPLEVAYDQAVAPLEKFREQGYEITAFAYPFGSRSHDLNMMLFEHYDVLRGAYYHELRTKDSVKNSFIDSKSIDNINYTSDEEFKNIIMAEMIEARDNPGTVVSYYSHAISDVEWGITEERLQFVLETAQNLGLKFYTYEDLTK